MSFKPTSKGITYKISDYESSTCLASSIDNFGLPPNSSLGHFKLPSSNAYENTTSETDLANNF